jgi:hypothetical protein
VSFPRSALAASVVLGLVVAACGATPSPSLPAVSSPGADGTPEPTTASCPEAPQPTNLTGWDVASQTPESLPLVISESTCGENRFLFAFTDAQGAPVAAPDRSASVAFYNLAEDSDTPAETTEGAFMWAIEGERGIYRTTADFDTAGVWGAEFTFGADDGSSETTRVLFTVRSSLPTVQVGQDAPPSDTPTLDDVGGDLSQISTDDEPVPEFYETSVAEAVGAGDPFVLIFATPKFCVTAQCGPTLDRVKPIAEDNPDVTFINVEPYVLESVEGQLQPVLTENNLTPVPSVNEWGLTAEPGLFVVDDDGVVRSSLGLIFSDDELQGAIDDVTAPGR